MGRIWVSVSCILVTLAVWVVGSTTIILYSTPRTRVIVEHPAIQVVGDLPAGLNLSPVRLGAYALIPALRLTVDRTSAIVALWPMMLISAAHLVWCGVRRSRPSAPGFCDACGYNLTGNISGTCPECGTTCIVSAAEPA